MMTTSQSLLEQIEVAQVTAKALESRISEALKLIDCPLGTDAQVKELLRATKSIYSLFLKPGCSITSNGARFHES
jgi:hypothetical protein